MFRLSESPIEGPLLPPHPSAGAKAIFEGTVRDLNEGLSVESLTYEAMPPLAIKEGEQILEEARRRFNLIGAACVHRVGHLQIGDVAIRVEAQSAHRREAFAACQHIVDEVKARVPIWKKEHYGSGESNWLAGQAEGAYTASALYDRQMRLPEVGVEGQAVLASKKVLVVGAGGLGSAALQALAGAGVGSITILDPDVLDVSNLHRQFLFTIEDIGKPKAERAAQRLRAANPLIQVEGKAIRITDANAGQEVGGYDVVLDCTDNFAAKYALNDACVRLGVPLVQSSIYQYEGHVLFIEPGAPRGCLRCLWPEPPPAGCIGNCADVGVLGVVPAVFGSIQTKEALAWLLGTIPLGSEHSLVLVDLRSLTVRRVNRQRVEGCPSCAAHPRAEQPLEITSREQVPGAVLIDIRELFEGPTPDGAERMPLSCLALSDLPAKDAVVFVCAHGVRSYSLAAELRSRGRSNVFSLAGGVNALRHSEETPNSASR